jgi:hypothetical protein
MIFNFASNYYIWRFVRIEEKKMKTNIFSVVTERVMSFLVRTKMREWH